MGLPYYRDDLALVHHRGFGRHADHCAPGILALLEPVRARGGLVLELGCGSGLLTRHLVDAGHRVIATDASLAMLALAKEHARDAEGFRQLVLPNDPLPEADAIVSVGHVLSYLADEEAMIQALAAMARAIRPRHYHRHPFYHLMEGMLYCRVVVSGHGTGEGYGDARSGQG